MEKTVVYLIVSIGMGVGGYLPMLFGAGAFSLFSILGSMLGGILAVVMVYKYSQ